MKWYSSLNSMPAALLDASSVSGGLLFEREKEAIDYARQLRIAEIDRLTEEVNQLDQRYDRLEDDEMKDAQVR